jgi:hypothetical protein
MRQYVYQSKKILVYLVIFLDVVFRFTWEFDYLLIDGLVRSAEAGVGLNELFYFIFDWPDVKTIFYIKH